MTASALAAVQAPSAEKTAAERTIHRVNPTRTPTSPAQFREALAAAHERLTGHEANDQLLDILTAHVSHETAAGRSMYNYNFGGIKGASPDGATAKYKTHEYINSKKTNVVDGFRAYRNLTDGAADYLKLLQRRYSGALERAERGDVDGFSAALKKRGYYTAPMNLYARAMRARLNQGLDQGWSTTTPGPPGPSTISSIRQSASSAANLLLSSDEVAALDTMVRRELPNAEQVARVMDAMSELALRLSVREQTDSADEV